MIHSLEQAPLVAKLVLAACALVLLHYWVSRDRAERALPRLHHPLALLYLAARRLWRNRSLVGVILGLLLIGQVASYFWLAPALYSRLSLARGQRVGEQRPWLAFSPDRLSESWQQLLSEQIVADVAQRLPQPEGVEISDLSSAGSFLVLLALSAALVAAWRRRPSWLPPGLHRRLAWPTMLTVDAAVLWAFRGYLGSYGAQDPLPGDWVGNLRFTLLDLALVACMGPALALGWSLTWQVARGGHWNLRQAVRDTLRCWPSVLVAVVGMELVLEVLSLPSTLLLLPEWVFFPLEAIPRVVWAFFFCLPWVIVGEGLGLREALAEAVAIWRRHWRDLALFVPRYVVVMLLAGIPFTMLADATHGGLITGFVSTALNLLYGLVGAMAVVIWYVEARKLRPGRQGSAEAAVNPPQAMESAL